MRKLLLLFLTSILLLSCTEAKYTKGLRAEIEKLSQQNDSLKTVVSEIDQKYVFDSLTIRSIPNEKNSNKINSTYKMEIVFVGYNTDGKSTMVIGDSTIYENGIERVANGDSLVMKKGGFLFERKLHSEKNNFWGLLQSDNKYGKPFKATMLTSVKAN